MNNDFATWLEDQVSQYKLSCMKYTNAKIDKSVDVLTDYLRGHNIKNVVLGISGGVDSSLVLGVLTAIKAMYIKDLQIHTVNIHFSCYEGIFDFKYINDLKEEFKNDEINFYDIDASDSINAIFKNSGFDPEDKDLMAQSSYALRYQILFTFAQKFGGITIGTTNKDEMSYIGWFGKNSDMVVDVQFLQEFHKFEVLYWADLIGIPNSILKRKPVGDLIDKSSDEENFGCSYDELAWYSSSIDRINKRNTPHYEDLMLKFAKVEALRKKNLHKYQGQGFNPVFLK